MIKITSIRIDRAGTIGCFAGKEQEKLLLNSITKLMSELELSGDIRIE